jgi:hypothetical protein
VTKNLLRRKILFYEDHYIFCLFTSKCSLFNLITFTTSGLFSNFFFVSDSNSIQLWRYENPELGPRKMPAFRNPTQGAVRIEDSAVFHADVENKKIEVAVNGTRYPIGSQLVYIVE